MNKLPTRNPGADDLFSALEARRLVDDAHSMHGEYMRTETNKILNDVKAAAGRGISTITVSCTDGIVESRLKNLGYVTKITYEQRDGDYMTISW